MSSHNDIHAAIQKLLSDHEEYYPHLLEERFPHVLQRVITLWGNKLDLETYLDGLLAPPRAGAKGFPQEAVFEIVTIKAVHRAMFTPEAPVTSDPVAELPVADIPLSYDDADHQAALVFDRMHRR